MKITTRPMDAASERPYVYTTARRSTSAALGGKYVHWPTVNQHVDALLDGCHVVVAVSPPETDILGYAALSEEGVEYIFLRQSLADNGLDPHGRRYSRIVDGQEQRCPGPHGGHPAHWVPRPAALEVVKALLQGPSVVLRRAPPNWVIDAITGAGFGLTIVPGGV